MRDSERGFWSNVRPVAGPPLKSDLATCVVHNFDCRAGAAVVDSASAVLCLRGSSHRVAHQPPRRCDARCAMRRDAGQGESERRRVSPSRHCTAPCTIRLRWISSKHKPRHVRALHKIGRGGRMPVVLGLVAVHAVHAMEMFWPSMPKHRHGGSLRVSHPWHRNSRTPVP